MTSRAPDMNLLISLCWDAKIKIACMNILVLLYKNKTKKYTKEFIELPKDNHIELNGGGFFLDKFELYINVCVCVFHTLICI